MANFNGLNNIDEALFTELTPEQSAMVEGGKWLYIESITCLTAGADTIGQDDTYVKVTDSKGNPTALGETGMGSGEYKTVDYWRYFTGSASINLYDSDWGNDDHLGGFRISEPTNGIVTGYTWGSGSQYEVRYSVSA
jgi:hypothetical protein